MCGRFHIDISEPEWRDIIEDAMRRHPAAAFKQGEICPTDVAPALVAEGGGIASEALSWGYDKPAGAKGLLINARAETVTERPTFAGDFFARRCLLPANAFFEWSQTKQKFVYRKPQGLLYLGGFYRRRAGKGSFVILTKEATAPVSDVHDRIPVIIDRADAAAWLHNNEFAIARLGLPYTAELLGAPVNPPSGAQTFGI